MGQAGNAGANEYVFLTRWRVEGTCGEVADVLGDPAALERWWPSVYLRVEELSPGDGRGVGRRVRLHTKGWLPYTLRWEFEVVESHYPHGFSLVASGDFEGRGVWTTKTFCLELHTEYGEMPSSRAAARSKALKAEPGWRSPSVARLKGLWA